MDRRFAFFYLVAVAALIPAGCRQSPYVSSHLELLGAERRALEDRVLDLEFELDRAHQKLESHRDGPTNSAARNSRPSESRARNSEEAGDMVTPSIEIPGLGDDLPSTLTPPRVNEGRPADGELPGPSGDSATNSPRYRKPTRPISVRSRAPGDPRITHIKLNPTLTGGTDFDRKSGDDGLIIVLEPRNADNEFVPLAGPITVVLLDYAKRDQGSAAMVGRWKLDAPTVHKSIVNDEYAQGIQLRLPWKDQAPEHSKLRLDVRYTTADGRNLDARADVYVTLPGQFSARWTPRAPRTENGDPSPTNGQAPVNIARQPDANKSAARTTLPTVTQSAFTTVSRAAEIVTDATPDQAAEHRPDSRPTWTPNR